MTYKLLLPVTALLLIGLYYYNLTLLTVAALVLIPILIIILYTELKKLL